MEVLAIQPEGSPIPLCKGYCLFKIMGQKTCQYTREKKERCVSVKSYLGQVGGGAGDKSLFLFALLAKNASEDVGTHRIFVFLFIFFLPTNFKGEKTEISSSDFIF